MTKIDRVFSKLTESGDFSGSVLVAHGSQILIKKGYGMADVDKGVPNTPQTKFRLASLTKQFTAIAILILQAQSKLDVHDRICKYLAECPPGWREITIHQLLTHTSGIPDFTDFTYSDLANGKSATPLQIMARFKDKPLDFKPGEKVSYSSSGYIVLGIIIERVSGQSYEEFLQQYIFAPLMMKDTGYDHNLDSLATGYKSPSVKADFIDMSLPFSAGGLYSTVEDLYRWDQALYTEQLIPRALITAMFTAYAPIPDFQDVSFGYGWAIFKLGNNHQMDGAASGIEGFSTVIQRYTDDKVTIIILSNREGLDMLGTAVALAPIVLGEK